MKIQKVREVKTPNRGTPESAGIDFYVPEDFSEKIIGIGDSVLVPSGIKASIPSGYMWLALNKSGVAVKLGLQVGAQVVDEDYEGEIHLHVTKITHGTAKIEPGMKLIQLVLVPVSYENIELVDELQSRNTQRGSGGFGSTGTH
jgi:dUTP pyrophosphatase